MPIGRTMTDAGPFSLASLYGMLGKNSQGAHFYQVAKNKVHICSCRTCGSVCLHPKTKWELSFTQGYKTAPAVYSFFKYPHRNILVLWTHFPPPPLVHLLPLMNF